MKYDFAVIGAGVSGLTASLLLADCGFKVVLIEKGPRTAGMIRGFVRRGVRFDTGFHYAGGLGEGDILDLFFRHLGLADRVVRAPLDPEGFDTVRCVSTAFEFRFPCGPGRLRARLAEAFPAERRAIDAFLEELERAAAVFPYMNIEQDIAAIPEGLQGPTLQEVLDRLSANPLLKALLSVHTLLHGVAPAEVPFALHAVVAGPYYRSAHSLRGGGEALAQAFDAELSRRGVEVLCGEGVEAILLEDRRPRGVRLTGGRTLDCDACISTVHPRTFLTLVPEGVLRPVYRRRLAGLPETPSACLLFGALTDLPSELVGSNLFLLPAPEAAARLEEGDPDAGPLYVTAATLSESCEAGGFLAIAPVDCRVADRWRGSVRGRRPQTYLDWKEQMIRKIQSRLENSSPGWAGRTTWSDGATPLTLGDYGNSPGGSLYGVKHCVGFGNPQAATRVPGLWLAGQATAGPGVLGAIISGYLACGAIVGHDRLRRDMRRCR